jgi:SAM-dependent methyltransferase
MTTSTFPLGEPSIALADLNVTLNNAETAFASRVPTERTMRDLEAGLQQIRGTHGAEIWRYSLVPAIRSHPVMAFLLQDPFTHRSQVRPRGYPGDAELLDMAYLETSGAHTKPTVTRLGREIFNYTSDVAASRAVRARKHLLAKNITEALQRSSRPRILSVACGHLRELREVANIETAQFGEFIALDQDAESLRTVADQWSHTGIRTIVGGVKDLIIKDLGSFDHIYAAGLYDYLPIAAAQSLTDRLVAVLKPQGTLLVANFLPDIWESGYMEGVMDWWLIQRSTSEIDSFADHIPSKCVAERRVWSDLYERIGYLLLKKA